MPVAPTPANLPARIVTVGTSLGQARENEGCRVRRPAPPAPPVPSFIRTLHGRIGDRIYKTYRRPRGGRRIVVTRVPDFTGYVPTAAQRAQRERMRAAMAYAQRIAADPVLKTLYAAAARGLGRAPFRLAISDWLRPADTGARERLALAAAAFPPRAEQDPCTSTPHPANPRVTASCPPRLPPPRAYGGSHSVRRGVGARVAGENRRRGRLLARASPGRAAALAGANYRRVGEAGGRVEEGDGGTDAAMVQSPIFGHPGFERIEAEGFAREGAMGEAAVTILRRR